MPGCLLSISLLTPGSTVFSLKSHYEIICLLLIFIPTQESGTDVFGDLVARLARLRKMAQLLVEHPFELEKTRGE